MLAAHKLDSPERLRAHLAQGRQVQEVRADGQGGWHWQSLAADDTQPFEPPSRPPLTSAKPFFFAEREALFRFDGGTFYGCLPEIEPQVLFGVSACDLRALAYQDQFFAHDKHYQRRRRQTLLVGFDCGHSCAGGFCTAVGGSPLVDQAQADLILRSNRPGGWTLLVASQSGAEAIAALALPLAPEDWAAERSADLAQVQAEQGAQAEMAAGIAAIQAASVEPERWEALGLRCLGCSGCTSVCPTCSCYAPLEQREEGGALQHSRVWDSCMYAGFQKEASGHNPAATPGQRVQRFWYHKFGTAFAERFGAYGCVGCGRCDAVCPGGIGAHGVMRRISRP